MKTRSVLFSVFFALWAQIIFAQDPVAKKTTCLNLESCKSKWEYGMEYLAGTTLNKHINTTNLNVSFWKKYFKNVTLLVQTGATISYAKGYACLMEIQNQNIEMKMRHCGAIGLGPMLQLQYIIVRSGKFSIEGEASGSILFYNRGIPAGASKTRFMFRAGPNACWDLNENTTIKACYRWMTSSSLRSDNDPGFYEGQGLVFSLVKYVR